MSEKRGTEKYSRSDYISNHEGITIAFNELIVAYCRRPKIKEIQERFLENEKRSISHETISKHLRKIKYWNQPVNNLVRLRDDSILDKIAENALKGDMKAADLYADIMKWKTAEERKKWNPEDKGKGLKKSAQESQANFLDAYTKNGGKLNPPKK